VHALTTRPAVSLRIFLLLLIVGAAPCPGRSAPVRHGAPEREVRAVWLTTVGALDWPSSFDTALQRATLRQIIGRLSRAGFNTIFFQVRGRGDALYPSGIEPWSHVMTGTPGSDPGWDPLAYAVEEAHEHGMEIHAWFNTYLVRGMKSRPNSTRPPHVINAHPDWVRLHGDEWWLDPGEREVEEYLTGIALDIVSRYDVDGLQLDYIRYPGKSFNDDATYAKFGRGMPRDRWRRENITRLVAGMKKMLDLHAPRVKFGVTPIGIYRNPDGVRGLESFSDVFQDSREWVRRGIVDYVAPQLYWPIGGEGRDPDFTAMVREWRREVSGRHFYTGIASYKPEVQAQGTRTVEVSRDEGADGEAFFRYGSLDRELAPGWVYSGPALAPAMPWKDSAVPPPPESVRMAGGPGGVPRITWNIPRGAERCRWIALYRGEGAGEGTEAPGRLVALLPIGAGEFLDTAAAGGAAGNHYSVSVVSRSGMESPRTRPGQAFAATPPPEKIPASLPAGGGARGLHVGMPSKARGSDVFFLPFSLASGGRVTVTVTGTDPAEHLDVFQGDRPAGGFVVSVDLSDFEEGRYRCSVLAGDERADREIILRK
jgi:uncharacterized lipoprotein YddW (UPF0748 family)